MVLVIIMLYEETEDSKELDHQIELVTIRLQMVIIIILLVLYLLVELMLRLAIQMHLAIGHHLHLHENSIQHLKDSVKHFIVDIQVVIFLVTTT